MGDNVLEQRDYRLSVDQRAEGFMNLHRSVYATTAEANRKSFESGDFAKQSKVVETGWKFVRTAQTPPPGPPRVQ